MTLQSTIENLATQFVRDILTAVRAAPLEELVGTSAARGSRQTKSGRLPRRSEEDVTKFVDRVCELLAKAKDGLRAEEIREKLGVEAKELPKPLAVALKTRRITKSGNKRATTYKLGGVKAKKTAPKVKTKAKKTTSKVKAKAAPKAAKTKKAAPKAKAKSTSKAKTKRAVPKAKTKKATAAPKASETAAGTVNGAATP